MCRPFLTVVTNKSLSIPCKTDCLCLQMGWQVRWNAQSTAPALIPARTRIANQFHQAPKPCWPTICDKARGSVSRRSPLRRVLWVWPAKFSSFHLWLILFWTPWSCLGPNQSSWEVMKIEYLQIAKSSETQNPIYHTCQKVAEAIIIVAQKKSSCVTSGEVPSLVCQMRSFKKLQISFPVPTFL